jgi:hypothetical protein
MNISAAGLKESHVHDVTITKESPNYRLERKYYNATLALTAASC